MPGVWWRHPTHRVHHGSGADPEDPDTSWRAARTAARLAGPWPADRLGRVRAGPLSTGRLSGVARRAAPDRNPQPLTAFHATVRTAREKSGFKAGLRQRKNRALSVDRKLLGTSTIGPHPAQPALRLLLMIGPARPTLAEVPLADLSTIQKHVDLVDYRAAVPAYLLHTNNRF